MLNITALLLAASASQLPPDTISKNGFEYVDPNCLHPTLTRLAKADIAYPNIPYSGQREGEDLRYYENIWGQATDTDTPVAWPGRNGSSPALLKFWKSQFVAAQFTVPQGLPPGTYVRLGRSTYYSDPFAPLEVAISATCGDFAPIDPACLTTGVGPGGSFKKMVLAPATNGCPLVPGSTYFVNVRMVNPTPQSCNNKGYCTVAINMQYF